MRYLRNTWYIAAFSEEVAENVMLARVLLGTALVLFRGPDGRAAALEDRCPHRFAPLSKGFLRDGGESIQCPYHGLRFNRQGICVLNPHSAALPRAALVPRYELYEKNGLIWLWAGKPDEAQPSLLPDYSHVTCQPANATVRGYMPTRCNYELLVDNILDLTHADYLHEGTLGSGSLSRVRAQVTDLSDRSIKIAWLSSGDTAPAAFDDHLREQGQLTDQWTEVTWNAPGTMLLEVGATLQHEPKENGVNTVNLHLATPQDHEHTHYWYWTTRNFAISAEANAMVKQFVEHAFAQQDKPMLEAQQKNMSGMDFWTLNPVLLQSDSGAVRVRRLLEKLIEKEAAASQP